MDQLLPASSHHPPLPGNQYKESLETYIWHCRREHRCHFHVKKGKCRFKLDFSDPPNSRDRCHFHHLPTAPAPRQPYRPEGNGPRATSSNAARRETTPLPEADQEFTGPWMSLDEDDKEMCDSHISWKKRLRL